MTINTIPKEKAAGGLHTTTATTIDDLDYPTGQPAIDGGSALLGANRWTRISGGTQLAPVAVATLNDQALVDSRLLAANLGKHHHSMFELLKDHEADFAALGLVRFQTGKETGGRRERYAMLNEDQAYLLLTYTRNSERVRALKLKLVLAFREARKASELRQSEYLPTYHQLHDQLHTLAAGSPNERHVHCNVNRLLNKVAGIEAGQRAAASLPRQSLMVVAQAVASNALQGATDHHDGYQRVKLAMEPLAAVLRVESR